MKIYVSLPISGHDIEETKEYAEKIKKFLGEKVMKLLLLLILVMKKVSLIPIIWVGGIEALLECDAVFFVPNWQESKGCMAEFELARIYGKKILM